MSEPGNVSWAVLVMLEIDSLGRPVRDDPPRAVSRAVPLRLEAPLSVDTRDP